MACWQQHCKRSVISISRQTGPRLFSSPACSRCLWIDSADHPHKRRTQNQHIVQSKALSIKIDVPSEIGSKSEEIQTDYNQLRQEHENQIEALPEWKASVTLSAFLENKAHQTCSEQQGRERRSSLPHSFPWHNIVDAMLATLALHVESRIAALMGLGFYTIGPCGEETLAVVACALKSQDSMALHYRHLSIQLARSWQPTDAALQSLLLDRARGYTISSLDPVTGGVHCSIGSSSQHGEEDKDFVVTSTLASQCSPAVGRALATGLLSDSYENWRDRPISLVTLGDGSLHHGHFWSAFHLARHARHRGIKCPLIFGISDNGLSISYSTLGYSQTLFRQDDPLMPLFQANGNQIEDIFVKTNMAMEYARKHAAPAVLLFQNLERRFGHAATDRQGAYLTPQEIEARAESQVLQQALIDVVEQSNFQITYSEIWQRWRQIQMWTQQAFAQAVNEPKVTRRDMVERMVVPTAATIATESKHDFVLDKAFPSPLVTDEATTKSAVMRKHMTRGIAEQMQLDDSVFYLGEDVEHGGYYLVTDGLVQKFPKRIIDFPPDETSLLGAGLGMSQRGLTPIVEIPYAKYLDCAADMFAEIAVLSWLTNRPKSTQNKNGKEIVRGGMLIRLQGFDRGLFGGNFHTHNSLSNVLLPGIDVVCFSNGHDYVRGLRYAIRQVKRHGHIVVFVDCTNLLNLRHVYDNDRAWETPYPESVQDTLDFDTVHVYRNTATGYKDNSDERSPKMAIVTFGNGVVTALQARAQMTIPQAANVDIVDCPCLNRIPEGLHKALSDYDRVLFADICKSGPGSVFGSMVVDDSLQTSLSGKKWKVVAAPRSYNPLGNFETFLNVDDVVQAAHQLWER